MRALARAAFKCAHAAPFRDFSDTMWDVYNLEEALPPLAPRRRCYETRVHIRYKTRGFLAPWQREEAAFVHCHDEPPSHEEVQRQVALHVPKLSSSTRCDTTSTRELSRREMRARATPNRES